FLSDSGMHDQARRQIAAQQPVMRWRDGEMPAQQVEPLSRPRIFADGEVQGRAIAGRQRRRPALVMQDVPWVAGKQQDIACFQLNWPAASRVFQHRRTGKYRMIWDFIDLARSL